MIMDKLSKLKFIVRFFVVNDRIATILSRFEKKYSGLIQNEDGIIDTVLEFTEDIIKCIDEAENYDELSLISRHILTELNIENALKNDLVLRKIQRFSNFLNEFQIDDIQTKLKYIEEKTELIPEIQIKQDELRDQLRLLPQQIDQTDSIEKLKEEMSGLKENLLQDLIKEEIESFIVGDDFKNEMLKINDPAKKIEKGDSNEEEIKKKQKNVLDDDMIIEILKDKFDLNI